MSQPKILKNYLHRKLILTGLMLLIAVRTANATTAADIAEIELGRKIYVDGALPSGKNLKGIRLDTEMEGAAMACVKCHRTSGLGSLEGNVVAPPISGPFLFAVGEKYPTALVDARSPKNITRGHKPYTEETFTKALQEGINISGNQMNLLMPKYRLNEKETKALMSYLRQLSTNLSPGISNETVRFATITTPGVDSEQSNVMVSMIRKAFAQRNANQEMATGRMRMPLDLIPRTLRNWELNEWALHGNPETWRAQLEEKYQREPVFAVISGISNSTWAPIHEFCEQEKLPCLFPTIPLPPKPTLQTGYYPLYFSRGVALEAEVLAKYLREQEKNPFQKIVQIYRDDFVGTEAAKLLSKALQNSEIQIENRILKGKSSTELKNTFKGISSSDGLLLWLRPEDLSALNKAMPKLPTSTFISGFLAEEKYGNLSKAWKTKIRMIYPYELSKKRDINVASAKNWLRTRKLPLINEAIQTEVFFNLLFLTDLTTQMLDNFYRDYLIEKAEDMISWGTNNSIYPRLSLGRDQRFASKGAYIAHFDKDGKLVTESEWLVP